ncbi:hypothetical protein B0H13DRAFT_1889519 [Mycena leptocephala]|nr:hypothetical protein B0H13DRAFT_1889519 [Mycena leptocephala]
MCATLSRTAGVRRERRWYGSAAESAESGDPYRMFDDACTYGWLIIESRGALRGFLTSARKQGLGPRLQVGIIAQKPIKAKKDSYLGSKVRKRGTKSTGVLRSKNLKDAESAGWQNSDTKFQDGENKYLHPIRTWTY